LSCAYLPLIWLFDTPHFQVSAAGYNSDSRSTIDNSTSTLAHNTQCNSALCSSGYI
jgi:hypothetical protein